MWGKRKPPGPPKPPKERPVLRGHGIFVYKDGTVRSVRGVLGNVKDMHAYVVLGHTDAGPGRAAMAIAGVGAARVYRYELVIKSRTPVERSDRNGVRWTEQPVLWQKQLTTDAEGLLWGGPNGRTLTARERVNAHVTQTKCWANTFNALATELGDI